MVPGLTLSPAPAGPATAWIVWSPSRVPAGSGRQSCAAWLPSARQSMPTRPGRSSPTWKRITARLRPKRRSKPSLSARDRDQPMEAELRNSSTACRRRLSTEPKSLARLKKSRRIRPFLDFVGLDPLREFVVAHNPYAGKTTNISQNSIELRGHQRPTAEVAVQCNIEVRSLLIRIKIVERILIHV